MTITITERTEIKGRITERTVAAELPEESAILPNSRTDEQRAADMVRALFSAIQPIEYAYNNEGEITAICSQKS